MKYFIVLAFVAAAIFYCGCGSGRNYLESYYKKHPQMHQQMKDSLAAFCEKNNIGLVFLKKNKNTNGINVTLSLNESKTNRYIDFDAALERTDKEPTATGSINFPKDVLRQFQNSIYHAISVYSDETFFAYKQNRSMLFARETSDIGVLVVKKPASFGLSGKNKLDNNTYIADRHVSQ
jgi:hypothetical protein